jgi:hypothetical protein
VPSGNDVREAWDVQSPVVNVVANEFPSIKTILTTISSEKIPKSSPKASGLRLKYPGVGG